MKGYAPRLLGKSGHVPSWQAEDQRSQPWRPGEALGKAYAYFLGGGAGEAGVLCSLTGSWAPLQNVITRTSGMTRPPLLSEVLEVARRHREQRAGWDWYQG